MLLIEGRTIVPLVRPTLHYGTYGKNILIIDSNRLLLSSLVGNRALHSSSVFHNETLPKEKPIDSIETFQLNEEKAKSSASPHKTVPIVRPETSLISITNKAIVSKHKSYWQRFVTELKHYYNGFKLLFIETKIAYRLLRQVLDGHSLTRRERKQFARTAADLFRLLPFSVFIIVPFMEFTLPIFLKFFPNMLPSTFKEADKEKEKLKKQFKVKLEMAKFLRDTLESTALKSKRKRSSDALPTQFLEFMKKIRSTGAQPSTEEIMKFSALFQNKSTLDNLDHLQLVALCKIIGISSMGPDYYLRFILNLRLRHLKVDDKLIQSEGIQNLNVEELQAACRERGMRSYGVSIERLRSQLQQWLDLHLNKHIPSTILLLSRALYLPENISQENVLKATIQSLPKAIENVTAINLAKVSGERIDNTQRIEYIKHEEASIRKEREEKRKSKALNVEEMTRKVLAERTVLPTTPLDIPNREILIDKALKFNDMKAEENIDVGQFQIVLEELVNKKAEEVQYTIEKIRELKTDSNLYKDDIKELTTLVTTKQQSSLNETRSAKALSKRIDKLVIDLDRIVQKLDKKQNKLIENIKIDENILKDEILLKSDRIQQQKEFLTEKK